MKGHDISDNEMAKTHGRYMIGGTSDVVNERLFRFGEWRASRCFSCVRFFFYFLCMFRFVFVCAWSVKRVWIGDPSFFTLSNLYHILCTSGCVSLSHFLLWIAIPFYTWMHRVAGYPCRWAILAQVLAYIMMRQQVDWHLPYNASLRLALRASIHDVLRYYATYYSASSITF